MDSKIFIYFLVAILHHSFGDQLENQVTVNEDDLELYRQIFLRLNLIIKDNNELKANVLELKEEIKQLKNNCGTSLNSSSSPTLLNSVTIPNCFNSKSPENTDINNTYCFGNDWFVIQRRVNGLENFDRSWNDYKNGFGNVDQDFFIGLEKLYAMTIVKPHELLIILKDFNNDVRYARYDNFEIGTEPEQYFLRSLGKFSGNAGDSLKYHLGGKFSTTDRDNDENVNISCAHKFGGGWWYRNCHESNLNGHYIHTNHDLGYVSGIHWKTFRNKWYSLQYSQMMIRPKS